MIIIDETHRQDEIIETLVEDFHRPHGTDDEHQIDRIDVDHVQRVHCEDSVREVPETDNIDHVVLDRDSNGHEVLGVMIEMKLTATVAKQMCDLNEGLNPEAEITFVDHLQLKGHATVSRRKEIRRLTATKKHVAAEAHRREVVRMEKTKAAQKRVKN